MASLERRAILAALAYATGNKTHAAARLGITRTQLRTRLMRFGLTPEALDDLPRPANILNAHPRETEAIMAKLDFTRIAAPRSRPHLDWGELSSLRHESEDADKLIGWLTRCIDGRRAEAFKDE